MASSDSQIDKSQRGRPKRAELPAVNINMGAQSINTERAQKKVLIIVEAFARAPGTSDLLHPGRFKSEPEG